MSTHSITSSQKRRCAREKHACYTVLTLLYMLSFSLFGLSFIPVLSGSTTRVYLWVLSCSIFLISSVVVLFLASFCMTCRQACTDEEETATITMTRSARVLFGQYDMATAWKDDIPAAGKLHRKPVTQADWK